MQYLSEQLTLTPTRSAAGSHPIIALHCIRPCGEKPLGFPLALEYSILDHHHPRTTNGMTSPVPLRAYRQHTSSEDYAESITAAPSKSGTQSHGEEQYDPYADTHSGMPWSDTAYSESVSDGLHKPSLSYDSKGLGKYLSNSFTSRCLRRPFRRTGCLALHS